MWRAWRRRRRPMRDWSGAPPGKRVLLEHPDPQVRTLLSEQLAEHGYRVLTCEGPVPGREEATCPLLRDEICLAVQGADAVISGLDFDVVANRLVAARVAGSDPSRPVLLAPRLRVTDASGNVVGRHHLYRTTVAPLVRRLHDQRANRG